MAEFGNHTNNRRATVCGGRWFPAGRQGIHQALPDGRQSSDGGRNERVLLALESHGTGADSVRRPVYGVGVRVLAPGDRMWLVADGLAAGRGSARSVWRSESIEFRARDGVAAARSGAGMALRRKRRGGVVDGQQYDQLDRQGTATYRSSIYR